MDRSNFIIQPHVYWAHRGLFADIIAEVVLALAVLLGAVVQALHFHSWSWLARSGAVLVVLGTTLMGRSGYRKVYQRHQLTEEPLSDPLRLDANARKELILRRSDRVAVILGMTISALGSIIWGYADLLPKP